jgi:hypothetical protein
MQWAGSQGFGGSKAVQAIHTLKIQGIIEVSDDDGVVVIELI